LREIPERAYILKLHKQVIRRLRREIGEEVSDSEEDANEEAS